MAFGDIKEKKENSVEDLTETFEKKVSVGDAEAKDKEAPVENMTKEDLNQSLFKKLTEALEKADAENIKSLLEEVVALVNSKSNNDKSDMDAKFSQYLNKVVCKKDNIDKNIFKIILEYSLHFSKEEMPKSKVQFDLLKERLKQIENEIEWEQVNRGIKALVIASKEGEIATVSTLLKGYLENDQIKVLITLLQTFKDLPLDYYQLNQEEYQVLQDTILEDDSLLSKILSSETLDLKIAYSDLQDTVLNKSGFFSKLAKEVLRFFIGDNKKQLLEKILVDINLLLIAKYLNKIEQQYFLLTFFSSSEESINSYLYNRKNQASIENFVHFITQLPMPSLKEEESFISALVAYYSNNKQSLEGKSLADFLKVFIKYENNAAVSMDIQRIKFCVDGVLNMANDFFNSKINLKSWLTVGKLEVLSKEYKKEFAALYGVRDFVNLVQKKIKDSPGQDQDSLLKGTNLLLKAIEFYEGEKRQKKTEKGQHKEEEKQKKKASLTPLFNFSRRKTSNAKDNVKEP